MGSVVKMVSWPRKIFPYFHKSINFRQCLIGFHLQATKFQKVFHEKENNFAFEIIESNKYVKPFPQLQQDHATFEDVSNILRKDWASVSASDLLKIFKSLGTYATSKGICITKPDFDSFIDCLTDRISELNDDQLIELIVALKSWPETPSVRSRNFIEVWAALDDVLLSRYKEWSFDKILEYVSYTYWLSIVRVCTFAEKAIQKIVSRGSQLTKSQLIQTYFYIGILRKAPHEMHNLEVQLRQSFHDFSIEDLAIVSMGMFKSKTPMRSHDIIYSLTNKIINEAAKIDEISLAALLKLIRYSLKFPQDNIIYRLLDTLKEQVPCLSIMCCVHIGLLGSSTLTFHKQCLDRIAKRFIENIETTRIKDLERLVLTFAAFNYLPTEEGFLAKVADEFRKPERAAEIEKYPKPFACCISFMTMFQFYPYDLIDKILHPDFLLKAYDTPYMYGREILMLDCTIEIECKDYSGNRLKPKEAQKLAKKYTDYVPDENFKKEYNIAEKMVLDIMNVLKTSRGGDMYVRGDHVLPHYQRGDIILCEDKQGKSMDISSHIPIRPFGTIKNVPDDKLWFALVVAGRNALIRDTNALHGHFVVKGRHLRALGYLPAFINYTTWGRLLTSEQKLDYIHEIMHKAKKEHNR